MTYSFLILPAFGKIEVLRLRLGCFHPHLSIFFSFLKSGPLASGSFYFPETYPTHTAHKSHTAYSLTSNHTLTLEKITPRRILTPHPQADQAHLSGFHSMACYAVPVCCVLCLHRSRYHIPIHRSDRSTMDLETRVPCGASPIMLPR